MERLQAISPVAVVRYLKQRANEMNMRVSCGSMQDVPAAARGLGIVPAPVA